MQYQTITLDEFYITGIAVRTTNEGGQSQKDIGALWQRFFSNNITEQIADKQSDAVYCVYTDYESGANGAYTTILGCSVAALKSMPENFVSKTIPKTTYQLYKSTGKLPESVLATWMHIWQAPINRTYSADFDVYGEKSQDPDNAEIKTYLSVQMQL